MSSFRRRFLLIFAATVAGALATTPARAQRRGPLGWADLDRDGTITREEFDQVRSRRFERLDANKDGIVTREEFMAVDAPAFERLDRNKDGKITPEEMPRRRANR